MRIGLIFKILIGFVCVIILGIGLELAGLEWYKFIAPKKADVKREVFENTKSFREGKKQELLKYYHEYLGADEDGKESLKMIVRHTFADVDISEYPMELKHFVEECLY